MKINKKKIIICAVSLFAVVSLLFGGAAVYLSDYYRADLDAIEAFAANDNVIKTEVADGIIAYGDPSFEVGFIFYPGGKVEYTSYEPLMRALASKGVLCVLTEMPFNLAVLDVNAADGICERFPEVDAWYIGGHSLGGSMAASYVLENVNYFDGLILLGSYSTADLSETELDVLSVFGSEDKVMNREKYEECKKNLPESFTEFIIDGGCHAYFGMYGEQSGDGEPTLSPEEQITKTANIISEFVFK